MTGHPRLLVMPVFLLVAVLSRAAYGGNTYISDIANVEVSEPNCMSFNIEVTQMSGDSATLTLRVYDVDEETGELDEVYLNGVYLGYLTGTNNTWSTTTFDATNIVQYGTQNTVQICIDPGGGESTTWVAEINWGQILVDGGSAEDVHIVSLSADGEWNAIGVSTTITASSSNTFRLEINLLDDSGNNKDIETDTFTLSAGATTTRTNTVQLPSEPTAGETFTIEANLFNNTTAVQQDVETTTWQSAASPPTDIQISSEHVDENLPTGTVVGVLDAIDDDSSDHTFSLIGGDVDVFAILGSDLRTTTPLDYEENASYDLLVEAEDPDENTYSRWIRISVDDVNESPLAINDAASVDEGESVDVPVLSNDTDPDGDTLEISAVGAPAHGTAVVDGVIVRYTPQTRYEGEDAFNYTVRDPSGLTAQASVTITVEHVNHPPTADAGSPIHGFVGDVIQLNAVFSSDPDLGDLLQYRWDLDEDGVYDTDWLSSPLHGATYDAPFTGVITLQVRDVADGKPSGETAVDTIIARIDAIESIVVSAYEDVDGSGTPSDDEPRFADLEFDVAAEIVRTDATGYAAVERPLGTWDVSLTRAAVVSLESRAFSVPVDSETVVVTEGSPALVEFAVIKTATRLQGVVYVDTDDTGTYDEADRPVANLIVFLDGEEESAQITDEEGTFTFYSVPFGAHSLLVSATPETDDEAPPSLLVPVVLSRTAGNEVYVAWPYDLGPSEGFLKIDVEKGQGGE